MFRKILLMLAACLLPIAPVLLAASPAQATSYYWVYGGAATQFSCRSGTDWAASGTYRKPAAVNTQCTAQLFQMKAEYQDKYGNVLAASAWELYGASGGQFTWGGGNIWRPTGTVTVVIWSENMAGNWCRVRVGT